MASTWDIICSTNPPNRFSQYAATPSGPGAFQVDCLSAASLKTSLQARPNPGAKAIPPGRKLGSIESLELRPRLAQELIGPLLVTRRGQIALNCCLYSGYWAPSRPLEVSKYKIGTMDIIQRTLPLELALS